MQDEMFPMTRVEQAELMLSHFQADVERVEKAVVSANSKLLDAIKLRDISEDNLRRCKSGEAGTGILDEAFLAMKNSAEKFGTGVSVSLNGGEPVVIAEPPVDTTTGEVLEDLPATPGGHVFVWYPGERENRQAPLRTDVGEHTTYGELVADYLTFSGIDEAIDDYRVIRVDGGLVCNLRTVIVAYDYGKEFQVEAVPSEDELADLEANLVQEPVA